MAQSPPLLAATLGTAVGLPAFSYWRSRYGGYAGQLRPEQAVQLLQDEDAVLVDIRWACCLFPAQDSALFAV